MAAAVAALVPKVKTVAVLLYPGWTVLDTYGPIQAFAMAAKIVRSTSTANATATATATASSQQQQKSKPAPAPPPAAAPISFLPYYNVITVAQETGPIKSFEGPSTVAEHKLCDLPNLKPDIFLVPGGYGNRELVKEHNRSYIDLLSAASKASKITATVCTGAPLFALTGLLDGLTATSNKLAWDFALSTRPQVKWIRHARWVSHINAKKQTGFITSSGVSAGTDMTLALIETLDGKTVAETAATRMEYIWNRDPSNDPFTNSKL